MLLASQPSRCEPALTRRPRTASDSAGKVVVLPILAHQFWHGAVHSKHLVSCLLLVCHVCRIREVLALVFINADAGASVRSCVDSTTETRLSGSRSASV